CYAPLSTISTSSSRRNSSKSSTFFVNPLSTKPSDSSRLASRFDTGSASAFAASPFASPLGEVDGGKGGWADEPANIHKPTLRKLRTTAFLPNMVSPLHDRKIAAKRFIFRTGAILGND